MLKICIQIFGYQRPDHLQVALDALIKNSEFRDFPTYIAIDGVGSSTHLEAHAHVVELAKNFATDNQNVKVIVSEEHLGLAKAVKNGINARFADYDAAIVLEDDIIVGKNFLRFMKTLLIEYENCEEIGAITSDVELRFPFWLKNDLVAVNRHSCWGWATWKTRWIQVDWNVLDQQSARNQVERKKFKKIGSDLYAMLDLREKGKIDSWAIIWDYNMSILGLRCIYPRRPFSWNFGRDGSGTNYKEDLKMTFARNGLDAPNISNSKFSISQLFDLLIRIKYSVLSRLLRRVYRKFLF